MFSSNHRIVLGEATAAGFASSLELKPNETEEVYTDTKIALFAFTWLLMLWRRPDVRLLITASTALQAVLVLAHIFTPSARYLLLARSFLGINGTIFPGALLLLSELCNKRLAMVATAFVAITPLSIAVAGPILSAIFSLLTDKLHLGWRTVFALDGTLGLLVALVTWWQAPVWTAQLSASAHASEVSSKFDWNSIVGLLKAKKLMMIVVFGCCNLVVAQAPSYLGVDFHEIFSHAPYYFFTVFSDLGATRLSFNVLTAAPYLVACCYMVALLRSPSNIFSVGIHMIVSAIGFGTMSLGAYFKMERLGLLLCDIPGLRGQLCRHVKYRVPSVGQRPLQPGQRTHGHSPTCYGTASFLAVTGWSEAVVEGGG